MGRAGVLILGLTLSAAASLAHADGDAEDAVQTPPPLPENVREACADQSLRLLGYGHMKKMLWDVFDASLWISGEGWNLNEPFALELRYSRKFEGTDIVKSAVDQWRHLGYRDEAQLTSWQKHLATFIPNVKVGDQLLGLYLPGKSTQFFYNGEPVGAVNDPAFGPAFFAIWLDKKTSQPTLRRSLLGINGEGRAASAASDDRQTPDAPDTRARLASDQPS